MAAFIRANFAEGLLAAGISALDGSITVQVGHNLPTSAGQFRLTIWNSTLYLSPALDPNVETVTATYSALNVYSITRAQELTVAHPHLMGDTASLFYTAGVSQDDLTWLGTYQVDETGASANKVLNLSGGKISYTNSPTLVGLTITGVSGVVKATAGSLGGSAVHADLGSIGANDHHNQAHVLNSSDHTVSGLTTGHVLQATGATTFGFAAVPGLHDAVTLGTPANGLSLMGQVLSLPVTASPTFTNLNLTGYISSTEIAEPSAPASTHSLLYTVTDSGFTVWQMMGSTGESYRLCQDNYRIARNTTAAIITKGQVVYFSGSTGNKPNVSLARANSDTTMPAVGIATASVAVNAYGRFMIAGRLAGLDTSAFSEGNPVYVSSTVAGGLTATSPYTLIFHK